ncbi:hypothetical protein CVV68_01155 [Arthrobacter livingstonensis]|uniref:Uncharacterized protein n=1 Tax=Arthrobacter livingstonensis TaxID=670078 RepID=A0A2V5M2M5_9MICC|nr:hypothetical protein [Arthrobacter livingstonensis]PYI69746.1 hypothetical protein CVV68_01155 [Arthrobacter livingstonensis]
MSDQYDSQRTPLERSETATIAAQNAPLSTMPQPTKRRRPKTEKELYADAEARAKSLKDKLLSRRAKNRDRLVEDLYREFAVEVIDGDLDEADRLSELRSLLGQRLGPGAQGLR